MTARPRSGNERHGAIALGWWCLMVACAAWTVTGGVAAAREELETDRDSFTFAPTTTGADTSILEASYSFIDNRTGPESHSFPEVLVRRGIGEKIEARLGFNYEAGGAGTVSGSELGGEDIETEEESRVLYGTKVETTEQDGWLPRSAAVLQGYTPVYGPSNKSTFVVGESFGWRFANGWEWTSAMRYGTGFEEEDSFNQWAPSSVVKIPVGERWSLHAEYFGIFTSDKEIPLNIQYARDSTKRRLRSSRTWGWGCGIEVLPGFWR
ncbi:MAG: transporter [Planctomycetia bacterium]|nr:transporter [Planctomycetia bacterium]